MGRVHQLEKQQFIPADPDTVWKFFSDPHNLQKITPPQLRFKVVHCPDAAEIYEGMRIEYRVSPLLGIPLKWVTLIKAVQPRRSFQDVQLTGPYTLWEHTHIFEPAPGGVLMKDTVRYSLPFGFLGHIVHRWLVAKKVAGIFNYREQVIGELFPAKEKR